MARTPEQEMILAAAQLMRTDVGQNFFKALGPYVETQREALVFAPKEHIEFAQGAARQGTTFLRLLKESQEKATAIVAAEEQQTQRRG